MKKNGGNVDRIIRFLMGLLLAALYFADIATGAAGYWVLVMGIIFLVTATFSFCPLYAVFGIGTCSLSDSSQKR
jgi:hypothetical protein